MKTLMNNLYATAEVRKKCKYPKCNIMHSNPLNYCNKHEGERQAAYRDKYRALKNNKEQTKKLILDWRYKHEIKGKDS